MAVPQTSIKLFHAWAAKHKEAVALEDQLAAARQDGAPELEPLAIRVRATREEAEQMLQVALTKFRSELQERGLV
jgi:hypothetical protein